MNKVIGTKSHPDSLSFNAKLFSYFARFLLPVWNLLNAFAPLIREIHQHDVRRHQKSPDDWITNRHMVAVSDRYTQVQDRRARHGRCGSEADSVSFVPEPHILLGLFLQRGI